MLYTPEYPEITENTPLEEIKEIHQRIWDYAIKHGTKPDTPYFSDCVACEYDKFGAHTCTSCPIQWPLNKHNERVCVSGLFIEWKFEKDPIKKVELARQIRDLPFKYELEVENV